MAAKGQGASLRLRFWQLVHPRLATGLAASEARQSHERVDTRSTWRRRRARSASRPIEQECRLFDPEGIRNPGKLID
jgi:hypothetical protein